MITRACISVDFADAEVALRGNVSAQNKHDSTRGERLSSVYSLPAGWSTAGRLTKPKQRRGCYEQKEPGKQRGVTLASRTPGEIHGPALLISFREDFRLIFNGAIISSR